MRFKLGCDSTSYPTVARWVARFKDRQVDRQDGERVERPRTVTTPANIDSVHAVIEQNPFSICDDIQAETYLCRGTINNIIHDCLKLRKITSRWVPHLPSDKNRADRVRMCSEFLSKFRNQSWRLCDAVRGDEAYRPKAIERKLGGRRRKPQKSSKTRSI